MPADIGGYYYYYGGVMVYDSQRQSVLFLTGPSNPYSDDAEMWKLSLNCGSPAVETHPIDQWVCGDATARFTVTAQCTQSLTYRWQWLRVHNGFQWESLSDGPAPFGTGDVTGSNSPTLEIRRFRNGALGRYRCVVSSSCISVVSNPVNTALCRGDFNCDTAMDFSDYLDFLEAFQSGVPQADFNQDDSVDIFDYLDLLLEFRRGC